MKIAVGGSMQFAEQMVEVKRKLEQMGHQVFLSLNTEKLVGKTQKEKEQIKLKQKFSENAIESFWNSMKNSDALLILNYDKNGVKNYIGGNSFMDITLAYYLKQKIYLLNPIPDNPIYKTELQAIKPTILNADLNLIR
ncbi:MAG: hypothetical protein HYW51_04010 [Candidatus Doudnabacteria bacterium]|nr:hypothetical protein [Candidatus Doudnabacteria bacterium]